MCLEMDLNTCDRFLEEDCHYQGEIILNTDDIADAKHCQILCQLLTEPRCNYWVFQEKEEGKNDCSLLASDDRSCTMIGGPRDPKLKECAPTTTTSIPTSTSPTSTELPLCSKTQLSIQETMSLQKFYGNESNCLSVTDPNVCSVCSCDDWEFNDLKTVVTQHNQSFGSIGIGSEFVMGVNFNGTFNTSNNDDDYIGFIFGFQDPSHFYHISCRRNFFIFA